MKIIYNKVKVKSSLFLNNQALRFEDAWSGEGTTLPLLTSLLNVSFTPRPLYPR